MRLPDNIIMENSKWPSSWIVLLCMINAAVPQSNKKLTYVKCKQMHGVCGKTFRNRDRFWERRYNGLFAYSGFFTAVVTLLSPIFLFFGLPPCYVIPITSP